MLTTSFPRALGSVAIASLVLALPALAQVGAKNGEWRSYGGDTGNTRYSPLDQINASNFNKLKSPGASRPTTSARAPNTTWKRRR